MRSALGVMQPLLALGRMLPVITRFLPHQTRMFGVLGLGLAQSRPLSLRSPQPQGRGMVEYPPKHVLVVFLPLPTAARSGKHRYGTHTAGDRTTFLSSTRLV